MTLKVYTYSITLMFWLGSLFIVATDSLEFLSSLDGDKVWIINGGDAWQSELVSFGPSPRNVHIFAAKIDGDGPKWDLGIFVDVVDIFDEENS